MTNPKHSRIVMLAEEALTTEWLSEGTIAEHVRKNERTEVSSSDIAFALRALKRAGKVEGKTFDGYKSKFWRRILRVRVAA
jgi:hypothetical protein